MPGRLREARAGGGRRPARLKIDPADRVRDLPHHPARHDAPPRPVARAGRVHRRRAIGRRAPGAPRAHAPKFRMYKVPGGHLFPFERPREAASIVQALDELEASPREAGCSSRRPACSGSHRGRGGTTERFVPLLELEVNLAHTRKRAEVTRIALQHFVAVGDRLVDTRRRGSGPSRGGSSPRRTRVSFRSRP